MSKTSTTRTKTQDTIIYFRESALQSITSDTFTFGSIVGSFWLNYRFIGNNRLLDVVLIVMAFFAAAARASSKKFTYTDKQALIKDLQDGKL